jgi:hypothetical protein
MNAKAAKRITRTIRVKRCQQTPEHKRPQSANPDEVTSTTVDLSTEPRLATSLAARGSRSERQSEIGSARGHDIEEFIPRAQALKDSRTRQVLRRLDLEADIAAARPKVETTATPQQRKAPRHATSLRKRFLDTLLEQDPKTSCAIFCQKIDERIHGERSDVKRESLMPLRSWMELANVGTWVGLHKHRKTKRLVQHWVDQRKDSWRKAGMLPNR